MPRAVRYEQQVKGRPVVDKSGHVLGDVDDMTVDEQSGRILTLGMRLRPGIARLLGVRQSLLRRGRTDVPMEYVHGISDAVVLRIAAPELAEYLRGARGQAQAPPP